LKARDPQGSGGSNPSASARSAPSGLSCGAVPRWGGHRPHLDCRRREGWRVVGRPVPGGRGGESGWGRRWSTDEPPQGPRNCSSRTMRCRTPSCTRSWRLS